MTTMASHLDELSVAFDGMEDLETSQQTKWSLITSPYRFFRFITAVKNIVLWWRTDRPDDKLPEVPASQNSLEVGAEDEAQDRRDRPQMHSDPASINRSLLDP
jgi:hypothetical protein